MILQYYHPKPTSRPEKIFCAVFPKAKVREIEVFL